MNMFETRQGWTRRRVCTSTIIGALGLGGLLRGSRAVARTPAGYPDQNLPTPQVPAKGLPGATGMATACPYLIYTSNAPVLYYQGPDVNRLALALTIRTGDGSAFGHTLTHATCEVWTGPYSSSTGTFYPSTKQATWNLKTNASGAPIVELYNSGTFMRLAFTTTRITNQPWYLGLPVAYAVGLTISPNDASCINHTSYVLPTPIDYDPSPCP